MDRDFPYYVKVYYGPEAKPPKVPGELAIETKHKDAVSRDVEIAAAKTREDVGEVIWGTR